MLRVGGLGLAPFNPASPGPIGGTTPAAITGTTITATTALVSASGTQAAPSIRLGTDTQTGLWQAGTNQWSFSVSGVEGFQIANAGAVPQLNFPSTMLVGWSSTGSPTTNSKDLVLSRSAAAILAITGDGTGTTSGQTGVKIGNTGTTTYSGIWHSSIASPSINNAGLILQSNATYLTGGGTSTGIVYISPLGAVDKVTFVGTAGAGPAITAGTATTDVAALSITRTNNNAAVTTGVDFNLTDTLSAAGYLPFQVRNAATPLLNISKAGSLTIGGDATQFMTVNTTMTDVAGVGAGTLLNAPSAGNPSKWIGFNDNGTLRKIPTWT